MQKVVLSCVLAQLPDSLPSLPALHPAVSHGKRTEVLRQKEFHLHPTGERAGLLSGKEAFDSRSVLRGLTIIKAYSVFPLQVKR